MEEALCGHGLTQALPCGSHLIDGVVERVPMILFWIICDILIVVSCSTTIANTNKYYTNDNRINYRVANECLVAALKRHIRPYHNKLLNNQLELSL